MSKETVEAELISRNWHLIRLNYFFGFSRPWISRIQFHKPSEKEVLLICV